MMPSLTMNATPVRFERGMLTSSQIPLRDPELWQHDSRLGLWVTRAMNCARLPVETQGEVGRWFNLRFSLSNIAPLRDYQMTAEASWLREKRGILVLPTGTGKTEIALSIIAKMSTSTLIVAPVRDLMYQWHRRIKAALGYDAGIIGDQIMSVREISCTTYASAAIHMERLGDRFKLIVFDECHHLPVPYVVMQLG